MRMKSLTPEQELKVAHEVRMLLHAGRDCMRNQKKYNTREVSFDVNNPYYAEAFGIMRALALLNYGFLVYDKNVDDAHYKTKKDLCWWFDQMKDAVLDEEHWVTTGECNHCLDKYGKDDVRKKDHAHSSNA